MIAVDSGTITKVQRVGFSEMKIRLVSAQLYAFYIFLSILIEIYILSKILGVHLYTHARLLCPPLLLVRVTPMQLTCDAWWTAGNLFWPDGCCFSSLCHAGYPLLSSAGSTSNCCFQVDASLCFMFLFSPLYLSISIFMCWRLKLTWPTKPICPVCNGSDQFGNFVKM